MPRKLSDCEACYGLGWLISSNDHGKDKYINEIQKCDECEVYQWDNLVRDPRAKKALEAANKGALEYHVYMSSISGLYALTRELPKVLYEQLRVPF